MLAVLMDTMVHKVLLFFLGMKVVKVLVCKVWKVLVVSMEPKVHKVLLVVKVQKVLQA